MSLNGIKKYCQNSKNQTKEHISDNIKRLKFKIFHAGHLSSHCFGKLAIFFCLFLIHMFSPRNTAYSFIFSCFDPYSTLMLFQIFDFWLKWMSPTWPIHLATWLCKSWRSQYLSCSIHHSNKKEETFLLSSPFPPSWEIL